MLATDLRRSIPQCSTARVIGILKMFSKARHDVGIAFKVMRLGFTYGLSEIEGRTKPLVIYDGRDSVDTPDLVEYTVGQGHLIKQDFQISLERQGDGDPLSYRLAGELTVVKNDTHLIKANG